MDPAFAHTSRLVDQDIIEIYTISEVPGQSYFSHLYRNSKTKELDKLCGLTGEGIPRKGRTFDCILRAAHQPHLDLPTKRVLHYFSLLAAAAGNFVGIEEQELRTLANSRNSEFSTHGIYRALNKKNRFGNNLLARVCVDETPVLFPQYWIHKK